MSAKVFLGLECKACGGKERYERDGKCTECCKARDRARYARRRPRARAYYEANCEQIRARARERDKARHANDPRLKMLSHAKQRAAKAGRECTIALEDIVIPERCPIFGVVFEVGTRRIKDRSPTLDRKDSSKGYVPGNIWVISFRANRLKSDATQEELRQIVDNWPA